MLLPPFLKANPLDQRSVFNGINEIEAQRIMEGYEHPRSSQWGTQEAVKIENTSRNRYANVFPWDKNRVRLPVDEKGSDYINASFIDIDGKHKYIAAQGPLRNTVHHFWAMCYKESEEQHNDVVIIAMVTPLEESGVKKCHQYWPDKNTVTLDLSKASLEDHITIPNLAVHWVGESYNDKGHYLLTELELRSLKKIKRVYHFHYFEWADAQVPPSSASLLSLAHDINALKNSVASTAVPIIHCSAGVGRTGTFIALDLMLQKFPNCTASFSCNSNTDPLETIIRSLRDQRMMMVQTFSQYRFLYEVLRSFSLNRNNQ